MYTVLANEVADVDKGLFRQVGRFHEAKALPLTDQIFAIKSIRSHEIDSELDCQNSFFITVDANSIHPNDHLVEEWMEPCTLYENEKQLFVELRYDYPLGLVNLTVYFLVPIEDCEFFFKDTYWHSTTFEKLQELGHFLWVAQ